MKYLHSQFWCSIMLVVIPSLCFARKTKSFGGIAQNVSQPVMGVIELIQTVCLIAGIGLLVGAVIKYKQHRDNPVEVSLGAVFALLLAGIALLVLTFIPIGT